jgi:nucleoside-diphosphate-sugar epimerase
VTLNELVVTVAKALGVRTPRWRMPVWPVYAAGAMCEAVCIPLRIPPPIFRRRVDFFTHDRAFNIGKANSMLGYAPQVYLAEGIARTAAWYRSQGLLGRGGGNGIGGASAGWMAVQPFQGLVAWGEYAR